MLSELAAEVRRRSEDEMLLAGIINRLNVIEVHLKAITSILYSQIGKEKYDEVLKLAYEDTLENTPEYDSRWDLAMSMLTEDQQNEVLEYVVDTVKNTEKLEKLNRIMETLWD